MRRLSSLKKRFMDRCIRNHSRPLAGKISPTGQAPILRQLRYSEQIEKALFIESRKVRRSAVSCVVIIAKTETARPGRVPGPEGMTLPMLSDRPDPLSPCKSLKTIIEIRPYRSLLCNGFCYGIFSARKDTFVLHQHGFFIGITSKN